MLLMSKIHPVSLETQHREPATGKRFRSPGAAGKPRAVPQPPRLDTSPRSGASFKGLGYRKENHATSDTPGTHRWPFSSHRSFWQCQMGDRGQGGRLWHLSKDGLSSACSRSS